jgi:hypothetical protein
MNKIRCSCLLLLLLSFSAEGQTPVPSYQFGILGLFHPRTIQLRAEYPALIYFQRGAQAQSRLLHAREVVTITLEMDGLGIGFQSHDEKAGLQTRMDFVRGEQGLYTFRIPGKLERTYLCAFAVRPKGNSLLAEVSIEEDLACEQILRAEMTGNQEMESLMAQAVVIRSYLFAAKGRHQQVGYDFCDTTHCQFLTGYAKEGGLFRDAVQQTKRSLLSYQGRCFPPLYTATCGGRTLSRVQEPSTSIPDSEQELRGTVYPYVSVSCSYCKEHRFFHWTSTLSRDRFILAFRILPVHLDRKLLWAQLSDPNEASPDIRFLKHRIRIAVGRLWGWNIIRSDRYSTDLETNSVKISGWGSGHNLGLCQAGAIEMGKQGKRLREILLYYYPGCDIINKERGP